MTQATRDGGKAADPRLAKLLHLWDRLDEDSDQVNSLGVTITLAGGVYSGLLMPGRVWARTLGDLLKASEGSSPIASLSVFFDDVLQSYEAAGDESESSEYLHLANLVIGLPDGGRMTSLFMRIRADEVTGWTIGTIGQLPPFVVPTARPPEEASPPAV